MNIFDYIISTKNEKLVELNTLDALIFTRLSYIHFEKITDKLPITINNLSNHLKDIHPSKLDKELIRLLKESKRFCDITIIRCRHISNSLQEEEFTAITILLPNKDKFISFRGTSKKLYDFKEDINMSFKEVPSSIDALKYLKEETKYHKLYLGGHSKGGHLAMFAASHINYFKALRINKIYNFDGPGFLEIDKSLKQIKNKIINYFPEGSIVGRIMLNPTPIIAIKTNKQGIEAHNLYNWKVEDNALVVGKLSSKSNEFHNICLHLLEVISKEKREMVINYIFLLIQRGEIKSIKELKITKIKAIINKSPHLLKEEKEELLKFFKILIQCSIPKIINKKNSIKQKVKKSKIKSFKNKLTIVKR